MYTDTIHDNIWDMLKAAGMPTPIVHDSTWGNISSTPSFARVFDWFIKKHNVYISIEPSYDFANELVEDYFEWNVCKPGKSFHEAPSGINTEFTIAAENAIKAAIKYIGK